MNRAALAVIGKKLKTLVSGVRGASHREQIGQAYEGQISGRARARHLDDPLYSSVRKMLEEKPHLSTKALEKLVVGAGSKVPVGFASRIAEIRNELGIIRRRRTRRWRP